jgi:hypothetical protein
MDPSDPPPVELLKRVMAVAELLRLHDRECPIVPACSIETDKSSTDPTTQASESKTMHSALES